MVSKPEKPLDFLIDKLSNPKGKLIFHIKSDHYLITIIVNRVVLIGPPGSEKKDYAKKLRERYGMSVVETGTLLKKEMQKKSPLGARVRKAFERREYGKL